MKRYSFFITLIFCFHGLLYSNVAVSSYVDKRYIFYFQDIIYTIELRGEYQTFSFDGINEKDINDFDIIDKNVESTVIHSDEYKSLVLNKKITYTMRAISKGTLTIPSLDIKYFAIDENKVLSEKTLKLDAILVRVYGNSFLIFSIVAVLIIIVIALVVIISVWQKYRKNKL